MMSTLIELLSHFVPFHSICQSLKSTRLCYFTTSFKHHLMHTVVPHLWLRCWGPKFNCEPALQALWWALYGNVNLMWWVLWFLSSTATLRKTFQQLFGFSTSWVWKMFEIFWEEEEYCEDTMPITQSMANSHAGREELDVSTEARDGTCDCGYGRGQRAGKPLS